MAIEKYYSAKKVLEELGICETTLWRIVKSGELVPSWVRGQRRFSEKDLEDYMRRMRGNNETIS